MKKLIFTLICAAYSLIGYTQIGYYDYPNGRKFTIDGITYNTKCKTPAQFLDRAKTVGITLEDVRNHRFVESGLYKDGTYAEDPDEVYGIILAKDSYLRIIYNAVRRVFPKSELEAHRDDGIVIFVIVDNEGNILETASYFRMRKDFIIQPEQLASIERELRANLKFELNREKADKFCYFEGQIAIPFAFYANDMPTLQTTGPLNRPIGSRPIGGAIGSKIPANETP